MPGSVITHWDYKEWGGCRNPCNLIAVTHPLPLSKGEFILFSKQRIDKYTLIKYLQIFNAFP